MMELNLKHFLKVGAVLCVIGAASALLIGVTNLLTSNVIEKRNIEKENNALKEVFIDADGNLPTDLLPQEKIEINSDNKEYKNLICYWNVKSTNETENIDEKYGYVFKTSGADKNNYGIITMLVAINNDFSIGKISIISNTESYASTITNDYVNPYNKGEIELGDVYCGATYGATIIKEMAESSKDYAKKVINNGK